jgi:hypothetical protein
MLGRSCGWRSAQRRRKGRAQSSSVAVNAGQGPIRHGGAHRRSSRDRAAAGQPLTRWNLTIGGSRAPPTPATPSAWSHCSGFRRGWGASARPPRRRPKRRTTWDSVPRSGARWWYGCGASRAVPAGADLPLPGLDLGPILPITGRKLRGKLWAGELRLRHAALRRPSMEQALRNRPEGTPQLARRVESPTRASVGGLGGADGDRGLADGARYASALRRHRTAAVRPGSCSSSIPVAQPHQHAKGLLAL